MNLNSKNYNYLVNIAVEKNNHPTQIFILNQNNKM